MGREGGRAPLSSLSPLLCDAIMTSEDPSLSSRSLSAWHHERTGGWPPLRRTDGGNHGGERGTGEGKELFLSYTDRWIAVGTSSAAAEIRQIVGNRISPTFNTSLEFVTVIFN